MIDQRSSGILLHPTSLSGPYGIGDLGPATDAWLKWLSATGSRYWQLLPIGPTGYGDSPYQCFSATAGNPMLISPDLLMEDGLLANEELADRPRFPRDRVDFGSVIPWKRGILDSALGRFQASASSRLRESFEAFLDTQRTWVDDFSLFMAIKQSHGGGPWWDWPDELRLADPAAVGDAKDRLADEIDRQVFHQFLFFRQWSRVRELASSLGVKIIGDIPIFVAMDSVDVWSHPELFSLDGDRRPISVAGVPPDYFSETGQLWGNPLYDWGAVAEDGYRWWIERLRATVDLVDVVRIDHFRGFVDYWEIPADAPTAETGRWVDGPGRTFFDALEAALGGLPIIAEDLGELHAGVPVLRDELGLPGMKILQFAFDGDPKNDFLPSRYPENCVVYTGTHDNDTILGWYRSVDWKERLTARRHLRAPGLASTIPGRMITAAWKSRARLSVTPMQDILGLGTEGRMNIPGTPAGNWQWRMPAEALDSRSATWLFRLNSRTGRSG